MGGGGGMQDDDEGSSNGGEGNEEVDAVFEAALDAAESQFMDHDDNGGVDGDGGLLRAGSDTAALHRGQPPPRKTVRKRTKRATRC